MFNQPARTPRYWIPAALVLVGGLAVTALLTELAERYESRRIEERFFADIDVQSKLFERELLLTLESVRTAAAIAELWPYSSAQLQNRLDTIRVQRPALHWLRVMPGAITATNDVQLSKKIEVAGDRESYLEATIALTPTYATSSTLHIEAGLSMNYLAAQILSAVADPPSLILLIDETAQGDDRTLLTLERGVDEDVRPYRYTRSIPRIGGRELRIEALPSPRFVRRMATGLPQTLLVVCLGATVITAIFFMSLQRRYRRVEALINRRTHDLRIANEKLQELSRIDPLTRVPNRREFERMLEQEWARHIEAGAPLAVIMIDIDFFKQYNDHAGHQAGDLCLTRVAQVLSAQLREYGDFLARYGGEEFIAILPKTHDSALSIAQRLVKSVEGLQIYHPAFDPGTWLTISAGVAVASAARDYSDAHALVRAADHALYMAKHSGRNRAIQVEPGQSYTGHHDSA